MSMLLRTPTRKMTACRPARLPRLPNNASNNGAFPGRPLPRLPRHHFRRASTQRSQSLLPASAMFLSPDDIPRTRLSHTTVRPTTLSHPLSKVQAHRGPPRRSLSAPSSLPQSPCQSIPQTSCPHLLSPRQHSLPSIPQHLPPPTHKPHSHSPPASRPTCTNHPSSSNSSPCPLHLKRPGHPPRSAPSHPVRRSGPGPHASAYRPAWPGASTSRRQSLQRRLGASRRRPGCRPQLLGRAQLGSRASLESRESSQCRVRGASRLWFPTRPLRSRVRRTMQRAPWGTGVRSTLR